MKESRMSHANVLTLEDPPTVQSTLQGHINPPPFGFYLLLFLPSIAVVLNGWDLRTHFFHYKEVVT